MPVQPKEIEQNLDLWTGLDGGRATLINLSENHTFRIDLPAGGKVILRVHRPGYNSREAIESELTWMDALRTDAGIETPRAIAGRDGERVQSLTLDDGKPRFAVLFEFEAGDEPRENEDLTGPFRQLGELAARCHLHTEKWRQPAGFTRMRWTAGAILDPDGLWGDWRVAPGVGSAETGVLNRLDDSLRQKLGDYGQGPDRFGIIHADMRLANLLIDDGHTKLIDFDDSGFCWFGYDFAAAISFFEDGPQVPTLREAWLAGYQQHRAQSGDDLEAIEALVMLRRMALLAWIGSHAETELAQSCAPDFAVRTVALAERFLATGKVTH